MNFIKLEGDLQPILGPLGQFLLINIKIFKFFHCNLHLFKFVRIPTKVIFKNFQFGISNTQNLPNKKPHYCKHWFMFLPSLQKTFYFLHIHLVSFKNEELSIHKVFHWFTYINVCAQIYPNYNLQQHQC
jgi:hypothetical protein